MSRHECAAKGCKRRIPMTQLMCGPDWRQVPNDVKRKVNLAWSRYKRDPERYAGELMTAQREAMESI